MLHIHNTATRKKEPFTPLNQDLVTMYTCGLTVYDLAHIGNLRAYTMSDSIRRSLEYLGFTVKQVQNFTDVGHMSLTDEQKAQLQGQNPEVTDSDTGIDKMEKAVKRTGLSPEKVAKHYIGEAMRDFSEMNFLEPHHRPRATEYIAEQIEMIRKLIEKGYAYVTPSAVYFDTSRLERYSCLTRQAQEDKQVGVREEVEVDPDKRHPADFRLWQLDQHAHALQWESPWGKGFPGWHIECSAMAACLLGDTIDIHTGGRDLICPHHENEIAQSESATGKHFVNYWYHNEMLLVDGRKMSKSLGNFYTLRDVEEKGFSGLDLRYFYVTANFRVQQNFTWEGVEAANTARMKLKKLVWNLQEEVTAMEIEEAGEHNKEDPYTAEFTRAVEDSFNMPDALATVWKVAGDKTIPAARKLALLYSFDTVLGLRLAELTKKKINVPAELRKKLEAIIQHRAQAKDSKDYATADKLREEAQELGFELIDTPEGTEYRSK